MDPRLSTRHSFTHARTHTNTQTHTLEMLRVKHQDAAAQSSLNSNSSEVRRSAAAASFLVFSLPAHFFSLSVLLLLSPPPPPSASFLTPLSSSYPSLLPLFSPPLFCWCCISQRDRLKQMPSWETGCMLVCVCVYVCAASTN